MSVFSERPGLIMSFVEVVCPVVLVHFVLSDLLLGYYLHASNRTHIYRCYHFKKLRVPSH